MGTSGMHISRVTCVRREAERNPTLPSSVLIVFNESCQTEVGHFTHQAVSHQDVGSSQVSVDVVHPLHVGHACCNLEEVTQRWQGLYNEYKHCLVFKCVWTVSNFTWAAMSTSWGRRSIFPASPLRKSSKLPVSSRREVFGIGHNAPNKLPIICLNYGSLLERFPY